MTAPPGGIVAGSVFAHRRPVKNALDPAARPDGRFGLDVPDRPQGAAPQIRIDVGAWKRPENRPRIIRQRGFPLRGAFGALRPAAVRADIRRGALVECLCPRPAQRDGGPVSVGGNDRILVLGQKQPAFSRPLPRYAEADHVRPVQPSRGACRPG